MRQDKHLSCVVSLAKPYRVIVSLHVIELADGSMVSWAGLIGVVSVCRCKSLVPNTAHMLGVLWILSPRLPMVEEGMRGMGSDNCR